MVFGVYGFIVELNYFLFGRVVELIILLFLFQIEMTKTYHKIIHYTRQLLMLPKSGAGNCDDKDMSSVV